MATAEKQQSAQTTQSPQSPTEAALVAILDKLSISSERQTEVLKALQDANPPKVEDAITPDYLKKNPVPKLLKMAYQNGFQVNPSQVSEEANLKLTELRSGVYAGGIVRVFVDESGSGAVHIFYNNKTPDQRMEFLRHFTSFNDLVDKIHAEGENRKAEQEARRR